MTDNDIQPLVHLIKEDLERAPEYVLVKARAILLLAKVSDFQGLKDDVSSQDTLINGVMNLYP